MSDSFRPLTYDELQEMSVLGLAHVGDAVYELMIRTWLCINGASTAKRLHSAAVDYVSAKAQAYAAELLLPELTGEELAVFKRGRNAHVNTVPKASSFEEYHMATGFEALFGYLHLSGRPERLEELFEKIIVTNNK